MGATSQALDEAHWRQAVSEGSLPPMVQADPAPSRYRRMESGGESTSMQEQAWGVVGEFMIEGNQDRSRYGDVNGWQREGVGDPGMRRLPPMIPAP